MNEIEKFNAEFLESFKNSPEFKNSKAMCIVLAKEDGSTYVYQTTVVSPYEMAKVMKKTAESMQGRVN